MYIRMTSKEALIKLYAIAEQTANNDEDLVYLNTLTAIISADLEKLKGDENE